MTKICSGWDYGNVYVNAMFSGKGKTSFVINKIFMSCLEYGEPLVIIANEQSIDEFRKMLVATAMSILNNRKGKENGSRDRHFNRKRLNEGSFTDDERSKLYEAIDWLEEITHGGTKGLVFVAVDDYTIDVIKNVIRHYAMRGVRRFIIDTAKPTDGSPDMPRWQRFAEDFEIIYRLARPNGGGLNLAIWANVQLADQALNRRYLNEHAFGDSKKIKNVASVSFLHRPVWDDEYEGGTHELNCWYYVPKAPHEIRDGESKWNIVNFKLDKKYGPFYIMFTSKNRRGQDNENGLDMLIFKPDLNANTWKEVGWCKVPNDHNY
jgi:hypothetical protein